MVGSYIPGTLPTGTRRRVPKVSQNRKVPLWTVEPDGQIFQGIIRVPVGLCNTPEHSNERLRFNKLITDNLARWVDWRAKRGWFITGKPKVEGPFDPPEGDRSHAKMEHVIKRIGSSNEVRPIHEFDQTEEYKWYMAEARFSRETPLYASLEDLLFLRHLALSYGVDPDRDPLPYSQDSETKDYLEFAGGLDPMQVAEERRNRLGLKREDYLFNSVEEPL